VPLLLRSPDAVTWESVEMPEVLQEGSWLELLSTETGVGVFTRDPELALHVWPHDGQVPRDSSDVWRLLRLPVVHAGGPLQVGDTARFRLNIHCGWQHLGRLDGMVWSSSGPFPQRDDLDLRIRQEVVYGFVHRVDQDSLKFRARRDGQVMATYRPASGEPPLCD